MRPMIAALMLVGTTAICSAQPSSSTDFQWPEVDQNVISDARLNGIIRQAREAARDAKERSISGERIAAEAKRRERLRGVFGNKSKPQIIDSGTIMAAFLYDNEHGAMMGSIEYPSGAKMTGIFGPDEGVFTPAPESTVREFSGWVFGAQTSSPLPMEGVFHLKNGETFTGTRSGNHAFGIYQSTDGQRRFVGRFDLGHGSIQPLQGILESRKGRLFAVLNLPD